MHTGIASWCPGHPWIRIDATQVRIVITLKDMTFEQSTKGHVLALHCAEEPVHRNV